MNRKEFLTKAGTGIAAMTLVNSLSAEDHSKHGGMMPASGKYGRAKMSAIHCILAAQDCLSHCIQVMGKGDKSMLECAEATRDSIAACNSFVTLASNESKFTKKMAALCVDICKECVKECKKHASHHQVCKDCMDACNDCIMEMKKI